MIDLLFSVTKYCTNTSTLTLEHDHPVGNGLKVAVNVEIILEHLKADQVRVGEWIHVIGYVRSNQSDEALETLGHTRGVSIQALLLWSAGPFRLKAYEDVLDGQKGAQARNQ